MSSEGFQGKAFASILLYNLARFCCAIWRVASQHVMDDIRAAGGATPRSGRVAGIVQVAGT